MVNKFSIAHQEADIGAAYVKDGEQSQGFSKIINEKNFKIMQSKIEFLESVLTQSNQVIVDTLEKFDIKATRGYTQNIWKLCSILNNSKILLKEQQYVTVQTHDDYITKVCDTNEVLRKELLTMTDIENGCYKIVDGVPVLDIQKLEEMEAL